MTDTGTASDVGFHQPQIVSEVGTIFATASTTSAGGAGCSQRAANGAMELGRRLLLAARAGDTSLVLDLMAKGAPFTNDWLGTSALHLAASNAHAETCGVLLRAGVSRESRTKVDRTPLHLAAYAGHADVVELLLQHGAHVDCRDMLGMTPLHWAAERGHGAVAGALLRHGADVAAVSRFRKTPPQLAAARQHAAVLAAIDAECKRREAAKSVRAIVQDRIAEETAATEVQQPSVYSAVHKKPKSVQEKVTKSEIKTEKAEATAGQTQTGTASGAGGGAAAALLKRHGITMLPADDTSTVHNALQSGRTVVLSDAGKLMLKESEEPASPPASTAATAGAAAAAGKASRGVLLTATPVSSTPLGVKVFTVNNRLSVTPSEGKSRHKIMTPQDLQQVKIIQMPADARVVPRARRVRVAGAAGATQPVKIIMNKCNFQRLVAGAAKPDPASPPDASPDAIHAATTLEPSVELPLLRSLLAQSQDTIAALNDELAACRARLAQYEQGE